MTALAASITGRLFDIAVIGGGVVGCAVARRAALSGASVILIEAASDILAGASKGNSAILHTGFDAPPGSDEHALMRAGREEYLSIRHGLGLPLLETGAIVVAWTAEERECLEKIAEKGRANGVDEVLVLSSAEVARREPHLAATQGGVLVPGEHVIDPWSSPLAYLREALAHGALFLPNAELKAAMFDGETWHLDTAATQVKARHVVNCAGLFGDDVDFLLTGQRRFSIHPRKGQFAVFDKAAQRLVKTIILPVPTERTKGVVLCPTIFGNVLIGPTAEEQEDRRRAAVDQATLKSLIATAERMVPGLAHMPVTAVYAGLRPASDRSEYRLFTDHDRNLVTVGGIRSTGLTAALGIARYVMRSLDVAPSSHESSAQSLNPPMPNLAEHLPRAWQAEKRDEIVCHCEMVTRREILEALEGPLPARDLGGLKRRTRASMGRCQGFYCSARVAQLTRGRLDPSPAADEVADG
jgi:glycerol-3-phosphate dehydrogenase